VPEKIEMTRHNDGDAPVMPESVASTLEERSCRLRIFG